DGRRPIAADTSASLPAQIQVRVVVLLLVRAKALQVLKQVHDVPLREGPARPRTTAKLPGVFQVSLDELAPRAPLGPVAIGPGHFRPGDCLFLAYLDLNVRIVMLLVEELAFGKLVVFKIGVADPALGAELHVEAFFGDDGEKGREARLEVVQAAPL